MSPSEWLSLATVCILGAMSPGPSLALVMRHTLAGGRGAGLAAALAHGAGVGLYAFASVAGVAVVVTRSPTLFGLLQYGGAAFLAYLGLNALVRPAAVSVAASDHERPPRSHSARDGFLIAFLNPKIAVFFLALFSQFARPEAGLAERGGMAALAAGIDAAWYCAVAAALSRGSVLERFRRRAPLLERVFGVLLLAVALRVVWQAL